MKQSDLKTIKGTSGSTFYVLGSSRGPEGDSQIGGDLECSMRIWVEFHNYTQVFFRIRIVSAVGAPPPWNMMEYVSSLLPNVVWSGVSSKHVSLSGVAVLPLSMRTANYFRVIEFLNNNKVGAMVFKFLKEKLPIFHFNFSEEEFLEFFAECIQESFNIPEDENGYPPTAVILDLFGDQSVVNGDSIPDDSLEDGF